MDNLFQKNKLEELPDASNHVYDSHKIYDVIMHSRNNLWCNGVFLPGIIDDENKLILEKKGYTVKIGKQANSFRKTDNFHIVTYIEWPTYPIDYKDNKEVKELEYIS